MPRRKRVVGRVANKVAGDGAVVGRRQAADHCDRDPAELALHEVRSGGEFVGDRDVGHAKGIAVLVDGPVVGVPHGHARGADGDIGLAGAPGAAHGVGDDDGDVAARGSELGAQACGTRIGIEGEQRELIGGDVGAVDTGRGLDKTVAVGGDGELAPTRDDADGFGLDEPTTQSIAFGRVGGCRHHPALDFGEDLARHREHVAVDDPRGGGEQLGREVAVGAKLAEPGDRSDGERLRSMIREALSAP